MTRSRAGIVRWCWVVMLGVGAVSSPPVARAEGQPARGVWTPHAAVRAAPAPRWVRRRLVPACPGVVIGRPAFVMGAVTGSDGRPLAGVVVSDVRSGARVTTTGTGRFQLSGLASGDLELAVDHPELGRTTLSMWLFPGRNDLRVPLAVPDGGFVFGRVWDSCRGIPVVGARVELPQVQPVTTDSHGLFVLPACCGTLSDIHVSAAGYRDLEIPFSGRVYRASVWVEAPLTPRAVP